MTHPSKRKGDKAELEVQGILRDLLGVPARRALGAGRSDDMGDIFGVPNTVISVANRKDFAGAARHKPLECETQRMRANVTFAATFIRIRGGEYRVVLTPEQWACLWREAVDYVPAQPSDEERQAGDTLRMSEAELQRGVEAFTEDGVIAGTAEWLGVYPGHCINPETCRGKSHCPRDYSCVE